MAKTADRLIEGIKRRITMPANQVLLSDTDILALADDVVENRLVPLMLSVNQNYLVALSSQATVADQASYSIPYRAIGRTLREAKLVDDAGSTRDLTLIALEDADMFSSETSTRGFYFMGDKVILVPTPTTATLTLELYYHCMPGKLVKTDQAGLVTATTATTVTVSALPTAITTGTLVDFVEGRSGNSTLGMDATVTNAAGTTLTFASSVVPTALTAGDYVAVAENSPVIQLPNECYSYLETATSRRALQAIGDYEGYSAMEKDEGEELKNLKIMLEPRIKGEPTKIINRAGLLRGDRSRFFRRVTY